MPIDSWIGIQCLSKKNPTKHAAPKMIARTPRFHCCHCCPVGPCRTTPTPFLPHPERYWFRGQWYVLEAESPPREACSLLPEDVSILLAVAGPRLLLRPHWPFAAASGGSKEGTTQCWPTWPLLVPTIDWTDGRISTTRQWSRRFLFPSTIYEHCQSHQCPRTGIPLHRLTEVVVGWPGKWAVVSSIQKANCYHLPPKTHERTTGNRRSHPKVPAHPNCAQSIGQWCTERSKVQKPGKNKTTKDQRSNDQR